LRDEVEPRGQQVELREANARLADNGLELCETAASLADSRVAPREANARLADSGGAFRASGMFF